MIMFAMFCLFLCFAFFRAYIDFWLIEKHQVDLKGEYKFCTSFITLIFCAILSPYYLGFLTLLFTYGLIFDTSLNWLRRKPFNYLGNGFIDSIYKKIPFQFYIRLILVICLDIRLLL